jgi:hypothetical protein
VKNNPLRYVDPEGLVLFAFDGTGNAAEPMAGDTISNVRKFWSVYDEKANGLAYYITGIGTTDKDMPVKGNMANGKGFDEAPSAAFVIKFLARPLTLARRDKFHFLASRKPACCMTSPWSLIRCALQNLAMPDHSQFYPNC